MSLSTLLEAAQYLDYLDSNQNGPKQMQSPLQQQQQQQQHPHNQQHQQQHPSPPLHQQQRTQSPLQFHQSHSATQPTIAKKSGSRRQKSSRKDAANTMLAMSLPTTSTNTMQMHHGVPIPLNSISNHHNYHLPASLSSSLTTGSPLSSFASTALLCSKVSGVTSASSSAASSLSSSDSSSSCGEILMGDNDFNQTPPASAANGKEAGNQLSQSFSHQQTSANGQQTYKFSNDGNQSFAHYIAATSAGPQLVTMSTTSSANSISASAPLDGRIRAGHVIHAAANSAAATGTGFDPRQFSIATPTGSLQRQVDQSSFGLGTSLGSDSYLSSSPGACGSGQGPMVMARAYPIKFSSISPSAHQSIMAFQQQTVTASSPTSSSSSYSRHRELHKTLEKNRRAHLRHCFELLKTELPASDCVDKKTSHINIIKSAIRFVLALRQQECEMENELQRLTRIKNELTEKLSKVRSEPQAAQPVGSVDMPVDQQVTPTAAPSRAVKIEKQTRASASESLAQNATSQSQQQQQQQQQPAAEQQLSFLLSQSKID